tara:strand:- start:193 stop:417 length:225 start_codon:yes stop_codon:yes gene_type:complete
MKYCLLALILVLTSCSLDKNSTYWNEDSSKKSFKIKKFTEAVKKNTNFKNMTFEEFNLFLESYSENTEYPDITN